jgi:hypothetical protein
LTNGRASVAFRKRLDVNENLFVALPRVDEAKAALVVPGLEGAIEAHGAGANAVQLGLGRCSSKLATNDYAGNVSLLEEAATREKRFLLAVLRS